MNNTQSLMATRNKSFSLKSLAIASALCVSLVSMGASADMDKKGGGKECSHKQHDAHAMHKGMGEDMHRMEQSLNLSEDQKAKLKANREAKRASHEALGAKAKAAQEALANAVDAGASDSKLKSLAADVGKVQAEMALDRASGQKAFIAVLTPEQKQKYASLKAERQAKMKAHAEERKAKKEERKAKKMSEAAQ